jgi:hypothetical protein
LAAGSVEIVAARHREAFPVLFKVGLVHGIGAKSSGQFEANSLNTGHEVHFFCGGQIGAVLHPFFGTRFENGEVKVRLVWVVFAGRVAPTSPSIAHFDRNALVAECVQINEAQRRASVGIESNVGNFEVAVADSVWQLE